MPAQEAPPAGPPTGPAVLSCCSRCDLRCASCLYPRTWQPRAHTVSALGLCSSSASPSCMIGHPHGAVHGRVGRAGAVLSNVLLTVCMPLLQDMQTLQRRMEFLRNEVMAAVASGRWEPPASDVASSAGEL